jgi:hypothetical protein
VSYESIMARLAAAERALLLFGWSAAPDNTKRGKALHELWAEWFRLYEADGNSTRPADHPDLSNKVIDELATRRDAVMARTLERIREAGLIEVRDD